MLEVHVLTRREGSSPFRRTNPFPESRASSPAITGQRKALAPQARSHLRRGLRLSEDQVGQDAVPIEIEVEGPLWQRESTGAIVRPDATRHKKKRLVGFKPTSPYPPSRRPRLRRRRGGVMAARAPSLGA